MEVKLPASALPSGVSTVTGTPPAASEGALTMITVADSPRMVPGEEPKSTCSASGTK